MSSVSFENITKTYGNDIVAVDDVDLQIESGEFVTIVGPSGSGKSTLLRMVAGLEEITDGVIRISEEKVNNVQPQNRGVAMVFQNYALYPHMTVRKNMSYGLKLTTSLSGGEINKRVEETAEMMGIKELLDKRPEELSGGQQQRVATGRAIVREPDVFLMDEPLSNLDAKLRLHMRTELQRLQEDLNTTTIYVTHDQKEAMTMSDYVVVLNHGELQQVASPEELYENPANKFVADFIGSPPMNFFDVKFDEDQLIGNGFQYSLPSEDRTTVREHPTNRFTLGIRPENIHLGDEENDASISAVVDLVESIGSDKYLYLRIGETECTARVPSQTSVSAGESILVRFDESCLHLFDTETEENVLVTRERPATISL